MRAGQAKELGLMVGAGGAVEGELTAKNVAAVYEDEGGAATFACRAFNW